MGMWRCCLLVAVGAALARSDARRSGNDQENAVFTVLAKSDLNDVESTVRTLTFRTLTERRLCWWQAYIIARKT